MMNDEKPMECSKDNIIDDADAWCASVGIRLCWLLEKNQWGHLIRGPRSEFRARMWVHLRERGYALAAIAALHGGAHSSVILAIRKRREADHRERVKGGGE